MLRFIDNNNPLDHDEFVKENALCNLLQSSNWAKVKENWSHYYTAIKEDDVLKGVALVLQKKLPLGFSMMYIPRGPILDYNDQNLITIYLESLYKWAKKKRCLFITFDPPLIFRKFNLNDKDIEAYNENTKICIQRLENYGAIFKGFTKKINETIQPRFHMGIYYTDDWEKKFPKSTLKSIRKALRKHVYVEEISLEQIDDFSHIMHLTEKRKQVHLRDKEYFIKLKSAYPKDCHLFLAKVNPEIRKKELKEKINEINNKIDKTSNGKSKLLEDLRKIEEEMASIEEVLEFCEGETVIACGLMICYGNYAEMLYAGLDDKFRAFRPQYLIYKEQFQYAFDRGYSFVTMGGIEGTLDDGLAKFKSNFNPTIIEYVGEFDLPVNKLLYKFAKIAQDLKFKCKK